MSLEIKALSTGLLRTSDHVAFRLGERVLYAAPNAAEPFGAVANKAALVTSMRFLNRNASGAAPVTINIFFVRYDSTRILQVRPTIRILPINLSLTSGQLMVEDLPLTLEQGDAILGEAGQANVIDYVINGLERDV